MGLGGSKVKPMQFDFGNGVGLFSSGKNRMTYTNPLSQVQNQAYDLAGLNQLQALQGLQGMGAASWDNIYNNPFTQSMLGVANSAIDENYGSQLRDLNAQLGARGLRGGSYDSTMRSSLSRNRDRALESARGSAGEMGLNSFTNLNNALLNQLQGLGAYSGGLDNLRYMPYQLALSGTQAFAPYQQKRSSFLGNLLGGGLGALSGGFGNQLGGSLAAGLF